MRLRTLILVGSVLFASACAKTSFDEVAPQGEGSISIQLAPEIEVKSETKAMAGGPDKNEFKIEIYKYKWFFLNYKGELNEVFLFKLNIIASIKLNSQNSAIRRC